jgi:hypothetical protein
MRLEMRKRGLDPNGICQIGATPSYTYIKHFLQLVARAPNTVSITCTSYCQCEQQCEVLAAQLQFYFPKPRIDCRASRRASLKWFTPESLPLGARIAGKERH